MIHSFYRQNTGFPLSAIGPQDRWSCVEKYIEDAKNQHVLNSLNKTQFDIVCVELPAIRP